jgi:hypothetical protein
MVEMEWRVGKVFETVDREKEDLTPVDGVSVPALDQLAILIRVYWNVGALAESGEE